MVAALEQGRLARHDLGQHRFLAAGQNGFGKDDLRRGWTARDLSRAWRTAISSSCFETICRLARVTVSSRRISTSAFFDVLALLDVDGADDAAGRVLHLLDTAVDDDAAGCEHRAREIDGRRPDTKSAEQWSR